MTHRSKILEALAVETGDGNFTQCATAEGGETVVHRFSWATGMASAHWEWRYRKALGTAPPKWVALEHPYVRSRLYQVAIQTRKHLQERRPALPNDGTFNKGLRA